MTEKVEFVGGPLDGEFKKVFDARDFYMPVPRESRLVTREEAESAGPMLIAQSVYHYERRVFKGDLDGPSYTKMVYVGEEAR